MADSVGFVFESAGGVSGEAAAVIKCMNRAVAENTNVPYGDVAQRFWQRLSIDIQRAGHRAFVRRAGGGVGSGADGLEWVVNGAEGLVEGWM